MARLRPDRSVYAAAALLLGACGVAPGNQEVLVTPIRVSGYSHNRSDVDVYLTCGVREGRWLGSIPRRGAAAFEIQPEAARCAAGWNSSSQCPMAPGTIGHVQSGSRAGSRSTS